MLSYKDKTDENNISNDAIELKFPKGYSSIKKVRVAAGLSLLSGDTVEFIDAPYTKKICSAQVERFTTHSVLDSIVPHPGK